MYEVVGAKNTSDGLHEFQNTDIDRINKGDYFHTIFAIKVRHRHGRVHQDYLRVAAHKNSCMSSRDIKLLLWDLAIWYSHQHNIHSVFFPIFT